MEHRFVYLVVAGLWFLLGTSAVGQGLYSFRSSAEAQRFQALTQQVRCMVCQGQSIAESNAPLAADLRVKIYHMIRTKKSDAEIRAFFVKRYGEQILLQPRFNRFTAFLWLFPWLGLVLAILIYKALVENDGCATIKSEHITGTGTGHSQ